MRDLRRNNKVNQKSLPMIRSFMKKPSQLILSNQHTGKTITVLKPAYSRNQHQIHDQSSMTKKQHQQRQCQQAPIRPRHFSRS